MSPSTRVTDNGDNTLTVNGRVIRGFIAEDRRCPQCEGSCVLYSDDYDAYLCPNCNTWLESACSDPKCSYCSKRPPVPFPDSVSEP
jgi:hypothetical protein